MSLNQGRLYIKGYNTTPEGTINKNGVISSGFGGPSPQRY